MFINDSSVFGHWDLTFGELMLCFWFLAFVVVLLPEIFLFYGVCFIFASGHLFVDGVCCVFLPDAFFVDGVCFNFASRHLFVDCIFFYCV